LNGRKCDKGRLIDKHGDIYEGQYKDGKRNGHGVEKDYDGYVYAGGWKDDDRHG
jgi:hypothetical protein